MPCEDFLLLGDGGVYQELQTLSNQASQLFEQGQSYLEKSEELFQAVVDKTEASFGFYHRATTMAYAQLADFYKSKEPKDIPRAEEMYQKALVISERVYGYSHPVTLSPLMGLATVIDSSEKPEEYEEIVRRALKLFKQWDLMILEHPSDFATTAQLSTFLSSRGRLEEGGSLCLERFQALKQLRGSSHPSTVEAAVKTTENYFEQCYSLTRERPGANEETISKLVISAASVCCELPLGKEVPLGFLGRMCVCAGDNANASIALGFARQEFNLEMKCSKCKEHHIPETPYYVCRTCKDIVRCSTCHIAYKSQRLRSDSEPEHCENHHFLEISNKSLYQDVDVDVWLRNLQEIKKRQVAKIEAESLASQSTQAIYNGESIDADYSFIARGDISEIEVLRNTERFKPSNPAKLERDVFDMRIFQARVRIPRMLRNWFSIEGLPEWGVESLENKDELSLELSRHVNSIFRLALPESIAVSQEPRDQDQYHPSQTSLYADEDLRLDKSTPSIRLLELIACDDFKVSCRMMRTNLLGQPAYDALSYVWGVPTQSSPGMKKWLEVNDRTLEITPNLHAALCSLKQDKSVGRIWVDAVCINQGDVEERGHQVAMMAKIYRCATTVRIHLGPELPTLSTLFQYSERNYLSDETIGQMMSKLEISQISLMQEYTDFVARPWWYRVWILQEYALATNDPIFYVGKSRVQASTVRRVIYPLLREVREAGKSIVFSLHNMVPRVDHATAILHYQEDKRAGDIISQRPRILFDQNSWLQATNPCDKIFGLRELLEPVVRELFQPDYTLSVVTIFERLAVWLLMFDAWEEMFWR